MKILVIGASGQVGNVVYSLATQRGHSVLGTANRSRPAGYYTLDLADRDSCQRVVRSWEPEVIVLSGALTNVDYCETHREEAYRINVLGPLHVAKAAARVGSRIIHLSTDYVFDGRSGPYGEDDPTFPLSYYGTTKLEGEKAVQRESRDWAIVRTTWVFGYNPESKNFFMQALNTMREGKRIAAYRDQVGNPTLASNLAEAVVEIAERKQTGMWNIVGTDHVSRVDYTRRIASAFGLDPALIDVVDASTRPQTARRPPIGGLRTDKARAMLTTRLLNLEGAFEAMRRQMNG